jgi:hypothetical protein
VWNIPEKIVIDKQDKATDVISSLTNYFGKQPKLPEWISMEYALMFRAEAIPL